MRPLNELRKMDKEELINEIREVELKLLEWEKKPSPFFIKRVCSRPPNSMYIIIPQNFKKVLNIGHYYKFYFEEIK